MGFQILSFIQAGALLGLSTCTRSPVNYMQLLRAPLPEFDVRVARLAALRAPGGVICP